jgi:hypothetical protein
MMGYNADINARIPVTANPNVNNFGLVNGS